MLNKKVVLVGYSGHGYVVADAAREQGLELLFYVDKERVRENPYDLAYLGSEGDPEFEHWNQDYVYVLGIGSNEVRWKIGEKIRSRGKKLLNIIHPRASVTKSLESGIGNFINSGAAINARTIIGDYCILNTSAVLEHECVLADAVHLAPGAVLLGNVRVGDNTFIGANSVVREGVTIGKNVIIGAGSVVLEDIGDNEKIVGNPGRRI